MSYFANLLYENEEDILFLNCEVGYSRGNILTPTGSNLAWRAALILVVIWQGIGHDKDCHNQAKARRYGRSDWSANSAQRDNPGNQCWDSDLHLAFINIRKPYINIKILTFRLSVSNTYTMTL